MTMESKALELVRRTGGPELTERLVHLDRTRHEKASASLKSAPKAPGANAAVDADVAFAGGGLSVLLAPILASLGARVAVFDRARAASSHREWNASRPELDALSASGLFDPKEVDDLIVARYREGICAFFGGSRYPVRGALDHAVDAGELLRRTRALAETRGVVFYDGRAVIDHAEGPSAVALRVRDHAKNEADFITRILIDARGVSSPYASADLVCPTVGGVLRGFAEGSAPDEVDPQVGEILATTEPACSGRQHVWEAFPGRPGETTVYHFYYADARRAGSLVELYARFFETLPTYKRGAAEMVRPTFGFIPGWSRLGPPPSPKGRRVMLVGDAAARHSPLTYCGFGAMLRSLSPAARAVSAALESGDLDHLSRGVDDAPVHAMTGALARLMASGTMRGNAMNELLDAAFRSLHAMGDETYAALLKDELPPSRFIEFLRATAGIRRSVYLDTLRGLGPIAAGRWGLRVASTMARSRSARPA
jgi:lycopene cyclase CruA